MVMRLSEVNQFVVGSRVVDDTVRSLRAYGERRLECLVLWLGKVEGTRAFVVQAITPEQQSISSEDGVGYFVSGETLFLLNRALSETGLRLLAQVHSHPGEAYHSETDDEYAIITADGGLSLVVPDFAAGSVDPTTWAVYRLFAGQWTELECSEISTILTIIQQSS